MEKDSPVWIPAGEDSSDIFQKATVVSSDSDSDVVKVRTGNSTLEVSKSQIEKANPVQFDQCDDMASLTYLNEPSVLNNLKLRYQNDKIYTHSGLFLVAVNPYKELNIYNKEFVNMFKDKKDEASLKPHIFATAQLAVDKLLTEKKDQSILVTGESGAGKTENTKKVIQYILSVVGEGGAQKLESQIIKANPILESFGNATTVRNLNSSRFGKFIKININHSKLEIDNAFINWYLLEKSRVIFQNPKERNYHVFYQLLKGASQSLLDQLSLTSSISDYEYLNKGLFSVDSIDDKAEFKNLMEAFQIMNFTSNDTTEIFKVLSIILHLGNIQFTNMANDKQAIIDPSSEKIVNIISKLLGVKNEDFKKLILTNKFKIGREVVSQQRTAKQAKFAIDALSKILYEKLFQFLVDKINSNLSRSNENPFADNGPTNYIGILDIAGFEIFQKNSFEQLCINYTNEKLQQFFNHHMFVLEQSEYLKEGISWDYIDFGNELKPTIELIEGSKGKTSIFSILDEECVVPKGSDSTFMEKLFKELEVKKSNQIENVVTPFKPNKIRDGFIVKHYAGDVEYSVDEWLDKNKDPLSSNMVELLSNSSNDTIQDFFKQNAATILDSPMKSPSKKTKSGIFRTVAQRHKEQLDELMFHLNETQPHFVRCILPNGEKRPVQFEEKIVLDQLRCNGVLEGIRIARSGYPNRIDFKQFATYYSILSSKFYSMSSLSRKTTDSEFKKLSEQILSELGLETEQYKVGISKLFFRNGVLANLEKKRDKKLDTIFTQFQSICRGKIIHKSTQKQLIQERAKKVIVENLETYDELKDNPWFKLISLVKPQLDESSSKEVKFNSQIKSLATQLADVTKQLESKKQLESQVEELQSMIDNDKTLIKDNEKELNVSKQNIVLLEKDLSSARASLKDIELESANKETKLKDLQAYMDTLKAKIDTLNDQLKEAKSENTTLKKEIESTKLAVEERELKISNLTTERKSFSSELESKIKSLETQLAKALENKEQMAKELETKQNFIKDLEMSVSSKQNQLAASEKALKEITATNAANLSKLTQLDQSSKEMESMRIAYEQADRIKKKYKQLKHDFMETKNLLDTKISEEIEFDNGRQFYMKELESTKKIVDDLKAELGTEKRVNRDLDNKIKVLSLEKDRAISDKKQSEMHVSQMKMRLSSSPDIVNAISPVFPSMEVNQLNEEIRILRTRLASESYENRQMKNVIKKNGIPWSSTSFTTINASEEALDDSNELSNQLKLANEAKERLQLRCVELQKDLLQYKSNFRDSMHTQSSYPSTNDYQYKYESLVVELEHKDEVIEDLKNQLKRTDMAKKRITSIHKQTRDILGDISGSNKLNEQVQPKENQVGDSKESIFVKQENLRLNSQLNEMKTKLRRYEMSNDHKYEQEEVIVQLRNGIQTLELKNNAVNASLELYKSRSDDYFEKLSKAEVEVSKAIREKRVLEVELSELNNKMNRVHNQREESEAKVNGLNDQIRAYEREISDKSFEIKQLKEDYHSLKEQLEHSEDLRKSTSEMVKEHRDSELDRMQKELVQSMNRESELTKQVRNINLQIDSTRKENQTLKSRNNETMKEVGVLKRALKECMDKNDGLLKKIQEHVLITGNLTKQISAMKTANDDLIKERDELVLSKRSLEDKLYEINNQLNEHMKQVKLDAENSVLVEQLKHQVQELSQANNKLNVTLTQYEQKIESFTENIDALNGKYVDIVEDNKKLTRFNQQIQASMQEMRLKMDDELSNKEAHWKQRLAELDDKLFMSVSSQRTESHKIESLERVINELEHKNDEMNVSCRRYKEETRSLEALVKKLRGDLRSSNEREAQVELMCRQLKRQLEV